MSLFFPFYKQKATNGRVPDHICPISRKPWQCFSFLFMTCLSWNYGWIMCNAVPKNKKISLKNSPQATTPFVSLTHLCSVFLLPWHMFICVWNENNTHQRTRRIKDYNSQDKTLVYVSSLTVLLHSFLWETTTLSSTGYGIFLCFNWQQVWHKGSSVAMVTGTFTWLTFTSKAYPKELTGTSWLKCFTAFPRLVNIKKMLMIKYFCVCVLVHKSGLGPSVVVREGIQRVSPVYSDHLWKTHLLLLGKKNPQNQERNHLRCSRTQMDAVRVMNRNKFLQSVHHFPPLPCPPSRTCFLWCEAGWRPIMSLCLFRQSCLKLWCVTRAELCSLRPTSVCQKKGFSPVSPLAPREYMLHRTDLSTALAQWSLFFFFFFHVCFSFSLRNQS